MKKIFLLLVFTFSLLTTAQQSKLEKIDSLLTFLNANNKFMGSIAIRENNKLVFAKAYGYADVETNKQLDAYSKLKIGSITKTFTATMIMQLVDEKKLSLDTKLSKFYPKIPNANKITIHHLLHHRTGIPDYLNDDATITEKLYVVNSHKEMIDRITNYESAFEPNSMHKYSNSNYYLLGCIIETITKKNFSDNLNTRIVSKLNLKNTLLPEKIVLSNKESFSYNYNGKAWEKTPEWDNSLAFAAGAIAASPIDLTIFTEALFNGKLVSETSLEQMKTMEDNYGKGLIIMPFGERKFYGHTGGIESFRAVVGYNIEEKLGIALIVNGDNFNRNEIMIGALSLYYEMPYTFPSMKGVTVNKEILAKYTGVYATSSFPMKITVTEENGELLAQATGQSSFGLQAKSDTEFEFKSAGIRMVFEENKFTLFQAGMETVFIKE